MSILFAIIIVYWAFHFVRYDGGGVIIESALQYHTKEKTVSYNDHPKKAVSYKDYLAQKAAKGTVLLMMTDYGYMDMFVNSYRVGNLSQYKNLVVLCIDEQSYRVSVVVMSED